MYKCDYLKLPDRFNRLKEHSVSTKVFSRYKKIKGKMSEKRELDQQQDSHRREVAKRPKSPQLMAVYDMETFYREDLVKYWKTVLKYHVNMVDVIDQNADFLLTYQPTEDYLFGDFIGDSNRQMDGVFETEQSLPTDPYDTLLDVIMRYHPEAWYVIERRLSILPAPVLQLGSFFWQEVSSNEHAVLFLARNPRFIVWSCLASNRNVQMFLTAKQQGGDKLSNFHAVPADEYKAFVKGLMWNDRAQEFLENHPDSPFFGDKESGAKIKEILCTEEILDIWIHKFVMNCERKNHVICKIVSNLLPTLTEQERSVFVANACKAQNPEALGVVKQYLHMADWKTLSANPHAMDILAANPRLIDWQRFGENPSEQAVDMMSLDLDNVNWETLSRNPEAISFLWANFESVNYDELNRNPNAIHFLEYRIDHLVSFYVVGRIIVFGFEDPESEPDSYRSRPFFLPLEKMDWTWLRNNRQVVDRMVEKLGEDNDFSDMSLVPQAVFFFEWYPHTIDWNALSRNPAAARFLRSNRSNLNMHSVLYNEKVSEILQDTDSFLKMYKIFVCNPGTTHWLFPLNRDNLSHRCPVTREQLLAYFYDPARVERQAARQGISVEESLGQIHTLLFS